MQHKTYKIVRWEKPPTNMYKLNSDGSCRDEKCGAGGIIRDSNGNIMLAFSVFLGDVTSNLAEGQAMLLEFQKCETLHLQPIIAQADSNLLTKCSRDEVTAPRRIEKVVEKFMRLEALLS
ncbi:uncharacterized protein LOC132612776 [Lycium barbarum]|uniref:uncharacterized protein LOC132612776 n=1 Tax=Lycium barbarum TaxID=112863 RepID=UPI00293EA943|nr:uncharacterized protein LOC132612776 [Lycium barbarum]